jgi:hypothetical protein
MGRSLAGFVAKVLLLAGACAPLSCGGRVITEKNTDPDPPAADGGEPATPPADNHDPASGSGSSTGRDLGGMVTLPECRLGFDPADDTDKPCHYVVASLCYDTKEKACACACKKQSGTACVSGFPQYNGHVLVTCN